MGPQAVQTEYVLDKLSTRASNFLKGSSKSDAEAAVDYFQLPQLPSSGTNSTSSAIDAPSRGTSGSQKPSSEKEKQGKQNAGYKSSKDADKKKNGSEN